MVGIDTIIWFVFFAIIVVVIAGLLWWVIGYCESNFPMPLAWKCVRVGFVVLCAFAAITFLLHFTGHPVVRL